MDETEQKFFIAGVIISLILIPLLRKIRVTDKTAPRKETMKKSSHFFNFKSSTTKENKFSKNSRGYSGKDAAFQRQFSFGGVGGYQPAIPAFGESTPFRVYNRTVPFRSNPFTSHSRGMMTRSSSVQMMNDYNSQISPRFTPKMMYQWSSESCSSNDSPTSATSSATFDHHFENHHNSSGRSFTRSNSARSFRRKKNN